MSTHTHTQHTNVPLPYTCMHLYNEAAQPTNQQTNNNENETSAPHTNGAVHRQVRVRESERERETRLEQC